MLGRMMHEALLVSGLIKHAARFHSDTAIVSVNTTGGVERSTWAEVERHARKLASALRKLGLTDGDRCATIAWNNRRHLEIYFGVSGGGMVCHTINPRLAPENLIYIVNDAADRVMFIDATFVPAVAKLRPHLKNLEHVVLMGPHDQAAADQIDGLLFFDELVASGDDDYTWPPLEETTPSSLCYTSGTTGHPKGVLYTHRSTVLHSLGGNTPDGMGLSARDIVLPVVPMFHVNAWGVPYIAAMQGASLVLPGPQLDGDSLARLIDAERVTIALGVPTIWMGLLASLRKGVGTAASMTRTIVGGSALPPSMIPAFRDEFGVELIHAWGMTETSPLGTLNHPKAKHADLSPAEMAKLRRVQGRPPFGVDLRIVDASGQILPNDGVTTGELQIKGHWIVDTYFGSETNPLTMDGWFDTGDIAVISPDGYMEIKDRSKDVIKSGGEWISSVELENIAIAHPAVANAAAVAARHPKWDERPIIIVVLASGQTLTEAEILAWYSDKVPSWQVPDRAIFVEALPLGGTGKVLKTKLRDDYGHILMD